MSPEFPEWPTKLSCVHLWVCACAIGDQPSLSPLIGEDEINSLNAKCIVLIRKCVQHEQCMCTGVDSG